MEKCCFGKTKNAYMSFLAKYQFYIFQCLLKNYIYIFVHARYVKHCCGRCFSFHQLYACYQPVSSDICHKLVPATDIWKQINTLYRHIYRWFFFVKTAFGCHTVLNLDYISNCICVNAPVVFIRTQDTEKKTITSSMKTGFRFTRFIWIERVVLKMLRLFVNRIIQWILCLAI